MVLIWSLSCVHSFHLWSLCPYLECFCCLQNWITSCNKSLLSQLLCCLVMFPLPSAVFLCFSFAQRKSSQRTNFHRSHADTCIICKATSMHCKTTYACALQNYGCMYNVKLSLYALQNCVCTNQVYIAKSRLLANFTS